MKDEEWLGSVLALMASGEVGVRLRIRVSVESVLEVCCVCRKSRSHEQGEEQGLLEPLWVHIWLGQG